MICVVDYGVGNIQAFMNMFKRLAIPAERSTTPDSLLNATHLVLPGVGHFDHAMQSLNNSGLRSILEDMVCNQRVPIIGICVGMQMLAEGSDEGTYSGLNWIPGRVRSFAANHKVSTLPMPHMGWNQIQPKTNSGLFDSFIGEHPQGYFLHSYYFDAYDKSDVIATTSYGIEFDSVVGRQNVYGIQSHPEKSHHWGEVIMKNFVEHC